MLVDDETGGFVVTCTGCRAKVRAPAAPVDDDALDDEAEAQPPLAAAGGDDGKYQDLVDMTAMVDIVFFLLIFFMITSAAGILSCIGMPPPKQEGAAASSKRAADLDQDTEVVTVRIDEQNRIFIDELEFATEADLRNRLQSARAVQSKKLLVKAHGNAQNGTYVMVQDLGYDLGFEEFLLSVAKEEEAQ
jgi:biopolymer transport protein ExbD/biopolymer transport protein TolR